MEPKEELSLGTPSKFTLEKTFKTNSLTFFTKCCSSLSMLLLTLKIKDTYWTVGAIALLGVGDIRMGIWNWVHIQSSNVHIMMTIILNTLDMFNVHT